MPDISRLNPAIRALESGNPAFVTFSPPEIGAAQSIAAAPYDGVVFEMEHNPYDIRTLRDCMLAKGKAEGIEVRGPVDHGFVRSIYFRDPNGYVIELTASTGKHQEIMDPAISKPHDALANWQAAKTG